MALWQCGFEAVSSTPTISSTVALSMPRNTCGRSSCLRASPFFFFSLEFLFILSVISFLPRLPSGAAQQKKQHRRVMHDTNNVW